MKILTAVTMHDGEPMIFISLTQQDLYDQVWLAVVGDYFEGVVRREPRKGETIVQCVDLYFKTLQKKEQYGESIYFSEQELLGVKRE